MKTALITGSTGGIGAEIANLLSTGEYQLVLVSRSMAKLQKQQMELSSSCHSIHLIAVDFSTADAVDRILQDLAENQIHVDVLVNNVGFDTPGFLEEVLWQQQNEMIMAMVSNLTRLTYELLTPMKKNGFGRILNLSSLAAYYPWPKNSVYAACKSYVLNFSLSLSAELKGTGVSCTALCPGPVQTGFAKRAGMEDSSLFKNAASAEDVARRGVQAMLQGDPIVTQGASNRLLIFAAHILPKRWLLSLMAGMLPK